MLEGSASAAVVCGCTLGAGCAGAALIVLIGALIFRGSPLITLNNESKPGQATLAGKYILIARPEAQSALTAELFRGCGARPLVMPLIGIYPPPDPLRVCKALHELNTYDVVTFTSANAVAWFWAELETQGHDGRLFDSTRIASIGNATTAALVQRGVRVDIVPTKFVGEHLAQAILDDLEMRELCELRSPRILLLRALVARDVVPQRLREEGFEVDIVPVYETRPISSRGREEMVSLFESGTIDCVVLTSSSVANGLADLLGTRVHELTQHVVVSSIGPITTATAKQRGLPVHLTASVNTIAGVISTLEDHYARGG